MRGRRIAFIATIVAVASGVAIPASHVLHESRDAPPERWVKRNRVPPGAILPVRIGMAQSNLDKGYEYLMAVADPRSISYGKHWTTEQIIEGFKPRGESLSIVRAWLEDSGISNTTLSGNKAWFAFDIPTSRVEALLHTEYFEHEDVHTGTRIPSCAHYHVPKHVQKHIDYITPGIKLLAPGASVSKALRKRRVQHLDPDLIQRSIAPEDNKGLDNCDFTVTPACIAALYNIPLPTHTPGPRNAMGVYEAQAQRYDQIDLNLFFENFTDGRIPKGTAPVNFAIDGGESKTPHEFPTERNGDEILLDLDMVYPIVYPQKVAIWDENDHHYQRQWLANDTYFWGFNQLLDAIDGSYCTYTAYGETGNLPGVDPKYPDPERHGGFDHPLQCGVFKPPTVLSISYGGQEADLPIAYQMRQCNEFLKLGLQGVTLLFASGDAGVGNYPFWANGDTKTGCLGPDFRVFNPAWPNTCPYVTNVGGTKIYPGHSVSEEQPEAAVYDPDRERTQLSYASGGGFSNLYPIPEYQKAAVEGYLTNNTPPYPYYSRLADFAPNPAKVNATELQGDTGGLYNRIGRAYPDVSANGDNGAVVLHGQIRRSGGTSQSTPIFAAIINRINEERLAVGKSTVGFINPAIYANPWVFNDVMNGSNPGCFTDGFKAAPGWDPVTGLGTPNYPAMLEMFMRLP